MGRRVTTLTHHNAAAGVVTLITVPAGKKYELIDVVIQPEVSAGPRYAVIFSPISGSASLLTNWDSSSPALAVYHELFNNFTGQAGEEFSIYASTAGGVFFFLTYVEVDVT